MRVFSDHAGVGISLYYENDEINLSEVCGIRISPRQSPAYQPMVRNSFVWLRPMRISYI